MEDVLKVIMQNWLFSLIAGAAGLILSRAATIFTLIVLGFYVGSYMLLPMAAEKFDAVKEMLKNVKNTQIAYWIAGIIGAVGMVILYKIALFLVGFFATGAMVYFAYSYIDEMFNISKYINFMDPATFKIIVAAVLGAVGGFYILFKERIVSTWIAIILGSGVLSVSLIHVYNTFVEKMTLDESLSFLMSSTGLYLIAVLFVVFLVIGYFLNRQPRRSF